MSYRSATTSYSGRTVDLLLLSFIASPCPEKKVAVDVSDDPKIVSGIEKMAQRFALLFLTQSGTVAGRSSEGTDFMRLFESGKIYDAASLRAAALAANTSAARQMMSEDAALKTADDESLRSSEVTNIEVNRQTASISVTIKLTSKAGDSYVYVTPLAVGV